VVALIIGLAAYPLWLGGARGAVLALAAVPALLCAGLAFRLRRPALLLWSGALIMAEYLSSLLLTARPLEWMSPLVAAILFVALDLGGRVIESDRGGSRLLLSGRGMAALVAMALVSAGMGAALLGLAAVPLPGGVVLAGAGAAAAVVVVGLLVQELRRVSG
jgi:hypothetical protein